MTHTTPAPDAPGCDMPDGCGAPAGQPCEIGCPSLATDEAAEEADALNPGYVHPLAPVDGDVRFDPECPLPGHLCDRDVDHDHDPLPESLAQFR